MRSHLVAQRKSHPMRAEMPRHNHQKQEAHPCTSRVLRTLPGVCWRAGAGVLYHGPRQPSLLLAPHLRTLHSPLKPSEPKCGIRKTHFQRSKKMHYPNKSGEVGTVGWRGGERGDQEGVREDWKHATKKELQQTHGEGAVTGHVLSRAPGPKDTHLRPDSTRDLYLDLGAPKDSVVTPQGQTAEKQYTCKSHSQLVNSKESRIPTTQTHFLAYAVDIA